MIPPSIHQNLSRLRRRERLIVLATGAAYWLALVLGALILACAIDWLIDRNRDTPRAVRRLLLAIQVLLAGAAALWWLVRPQLKRLPDDALALWVEERQPGLAHRLITTVQLGRAGARSEGMSPELIQVVTRETESQSQALDFAAVADHRRLRRALQILVPVAALALL